MSDTVEKELQERAIKRLLHARSSAIQTEREKIADWLYQEIFSGFVTTITHHQAVMIDKAIRSGTYAHPTQEPQP